MTEPDQTKFPDIRLRNPRDPGGRTSRGITQTEWTAYVARHRAQQLPSDVWKAPDAAIDDIYRTRYWDALR
mgnify:FL=1